MNPKPIDPLILAKVTDVYSDGGVKGKNPSLIGGSWAFVLVGNGEAVYSDSGIVTPGCVGMEAVSNNMTELLALLFALEQLPDNWSGVAYLDSLITLRRFDSLSAKMKNIPDVIADRVRSTISRLNFKMVLLAGHPDEDDLERGWKLNDSGNRYPVSRFNAMCDDLCNKAKSHWDAK